MGNKVQGVLWDGKRHTHKSECEPTDADGDIVKHTCCVCVSPSVCLGPCQDGLLSYPWLQKTDCPHPLFVGGSYQDRSYPGPMSRERRKLLLTHCGMRDAGCMWTRILNKIPYKNQSRCFLVCCCWMGHVFPCLMAVDQWGKIFLDSLSFSTVYPSAGWPCDWKKGGVVLAAVPPEVQICQQDVIYLFFPIHLLGMELSSSFYLGAAC